MTIMTSKNSLFLFARLHKKMSLWNHLPVLNYFFSPCAFTTSQDTSKVKGFLFAPQWRSQMPASSCPLPPHSHPPTPSPPRPYNPASWVILRGHSTSKGTQTTLQSNYAPTLLLLQASSAIKKKENSMCLQPSLVFRIIPCTLFPLQTSSNSSYSLSRKLALFVHNVYQLVIPSCMIVSLTILKVQM